jgi:hypothetical protein
VSVDPSSLIFVVIVGIWAVYLVQHWVRRREQLATSRSVDRFSEAMRVLERRVPIPVELPARQNRSYVVAAAPATATVTTRPPGASRSLPTTEVAMTQAPNVRTARPATAPTARSSALPAARPSARAVTARPPRRTHRLRALILLTLLVATPSVWAAHVFGTLLLWPTVTVTALLVLDLLLVRSAVRREQAHRRTLARRSDAVRRPAPAARAAGGGRKQRPTTQARPFPATPAAAAAGRDAAVKARSVPARDARPVISSRAASDTVPDAGNESRPMHSQDAVTEVIVLEGSWEPVAVPPPTYTMKAKADRPSGPPAGPLVADSDSAPTREPLQPAVAIDELDLDSVLDRRRAAGA